MLGTLARGDKEEAPETSREAPRSGAFERAFAQGRHMTKPEDVLARKRNQGSKLC